MILSSLILYILNFNLQSAYEDDDDADEDEDDDTNKHFKPYKLCSICL